MKLSEDSAETEHGTLQGLYWLTKLRTNNSHPVYEKIVDRRGLLYRRGNDWIVGYDTGDRDIGDAGRRISTC